jgi:hypothetical protein
LPDRGWRRGMPTRDRLHSRRQRPDTQSAITADSCRYVGKFRCDLVLQKLSRASPMSLPDPSRWPASRRPSQLPPTTAARRWAHARITCRDDCGIAGQPADRGRITRGHTGTRTTHRQFAGGISAEFCADRCSTILRIWPTNLIAEETTLHLLRLSFGRCRQ